MNKKFINLLLASVLTVGSVQVFTSCKDNEADLVKETQFQYESLDARLTADEQKLADLTADLNAFKIQITKDLADAKADLQNQLNEFNAKFEEAVKKHGEDINKISKDLADYIIKNDAELVKLKELIEENTKNITQLQTDLSLLTQRVYELELAKATIEGNVAKLQELTAELKEIVAGHGATLDEYGKRLDGLDIIAADLLARIEKLEEIAAEHGGRLDVLEDTAVDHETRIAALEVAAAALGVDVEALKKDVANLTSTVTSQGVRLGVVETSLTQAQEDIKQLTINFNDFKTEVAGNQVITNNRLEALEMFKTTWEGLLPEIQKNAAEALAQAKANLYSINAINVTIAELQQTDAAQQEEIDQLKKDYEAQQLLIEDIKESLKNYVTSVEFNAAIGDINIEIKTLNGLIEALKNKDIELAELANNNYRKSIAYTNLMIEQVLAKIAENYGDLFSQIEAVNGKVDQLKTYDAYLKQQIDKNATDIINLGKDIAEVDGKIGAVSKALNEVTGRLDAIDARLDAIDGRITSIVLQGTEDNVFGSLRLPFGIQSNLLIAYLGEVGNGGGEVEFPLVDESAGTYNGEKFPNTLTKEEARMLKVGYGSESVVPVQTIRGLYMNESARSTENAPKGHLGYVYATFNPSSVNVMDNEKFSYHMVNSRGERLTEPLVFVPSDKELNFGYSRGGKDNGFYVAEATVAVNEAATNSIRFTFNEDLKSTVKDILKHPRANANRQTVLELANAVYNQVNGFLPAIGVEASWNDDKNGLMKVTSNYGIATAVVKPLSFKFLYGVTPGKHIPTIMPQLDKIKDKFEVIFDEFEQKLTIKLYDPDNKFTIGDVTLTPPTININLNPENVKVSPVTINIEPIKVNMPVSTNPDGSLNYEEQEVFGGYHDVIDMTDDLQNIIRDLQTNLDNSMSGLKDSFNTTNEQLKSLTKEIADQVNELLEGMQNTVDTTIDDLLSDIKNKVNEALDNARLNSLINRLDGIINKMNDMIDNANYYLQPTLMYNNNGSFGMVSSSAAMPTVMVLKDGGNAVNLVPTTMTYETVVPVCKKYVAVTGVWDNKDVNKEYNLEAYLWEINNNTENNTSMNKVLDGRIRQIPMKLQKGHTYEIFYQALDFNGYVSGRKYYICVK